MEIKAFNPILVWFYPTATAVLSCEHTHFQSHFGLILSCENTFRERRQPPSFNPILVWFYPVLTSIPSSLNSLSIPFWSDFIESPSPVWPLSILSLSIPFWSDFIAQGFFNHLWDFRRLSIPFWSDFIPSPSQYTRTVPLSFNPILVWFYPT